MRFLYARLLTRPVIADGELSLACPAAICWGRAGRRRGRSPARPERPAHLGPG